MLKAQSKALLELAKEQFRKIHKDIKERREFNKLVEEHFWDEENKGFIASEHISGTKKNLQGIINPVYRAVYVLKKSNAFTIPEIAAVLHVSERSVSRIYAGV